MCCVTFAAEPSAAAQVCCPCSSSLTEPCCLQDPYANYVLQSALTISSGQLHLDLVESIRPFLPTLRGTPHGKRILSKINVKL